MKLYCFLILAVTLVASSESCKKDTCSTTPVFDNLQVSAVSKKESLLPITITWTNVSNLSTDYFEAFTLVQAPEDAFGNNWQNDFEVVESLSVAELGQFVLTLKTEKLENEKEFHFHFLFPDKQDYSTCTHPGSKDFYQLDLVVQVKDKEQIMPIIDNFQWKEIHLKGGM